jgi:hypothetical protein
LGDGGFFPDGLFLRVVPQIWGLCPDSQ